MIAKEYLCEVAAMLESYPIYEGDTAHIRIEVNTAREIAANFREIARNMTNGILH